jgi:hypothetical protein
MMHRRAKVFPSPPVVRGRVGRGLCRCGRQRRLAGGQTSRRAPSSILPRNTGGGGRCSGRRRSERYFAHHRADQFLILRLYLNQHPTIARHGRQHLPQGWNNIRQFSPFRFAHQPPHRSRALQGLIVNNNRHAIRRGMNIAFAPLDPRLPRGSERRQRILRVNGVQTARCNNWLIYLRVRWRVLTNTNHEYRAKSESRQSHDHCL